MGELLKGIPRIQLTNSRPGRLRPGFPAGRDAFESGIPQPGGDVRPPGRAHVRAPMSAPVVIEDPGDARLSDYVDLADPDVRRRVEAERGFFIAESPLVVRRLLESGRRVRSVLVTPAQYDALHDVLNDVLAGPDSD